MELYKIKELFYSKENSKESEETIIEWKKDMPTIHLIKD
jgi:hypothetical protein